MVVLAKRAVAIQVLGTLGYLAVLLCMLLMSTIPAMLLLLLFFGDTDDAPVAARYLLFAVFWALSLKLFWPEFAARSFGEVSLERGVLTVSRWGNVRHWPLSTLRSFEATQHGYKATAADGRALKIQEAASYGPLLRDLATSAIADTLHRRLSAGETLTFSQPAIHLLGQQTPGVITLALIVGAVLYAAGFSTSALCGLLALAAIALYRRSKQRWGLVLSDSGFRGTDDVSFRPWSETQSVRFDGARLTLVGPDRDLALLGGAELEALRLLLIRRASAAHLALQDETADTPDPTESPEEAPG